MKKLYLLIFCGAMLLSCSQELLNSEADITAVEFGSNANVFQGKHILGNPIISNDEIRIPKNISNTADSAAVDAALRTLSLNFTLTAGATIEPANGTVVNFIENPSQKFTITSQDGKWQKTYSISFFSVFNKSEFSFELYECPVGKQYHVFYELIDNERQYIWASGNSGFSLTAGSAPAENYPTSWVPNGKVGGAVQLVTRSTGSLGTSIGKPIAAGNIFLGFFDISKAMTDALSATHLGVQTTQTDLQALGLWANYQPGPEYKDAAGNVLPVTDHPDLYAVLYLAHLDAKGNPIMLDGSNGKTAPNIVAKAEITDVQRAYITRQNASDLTYRYIELPFETYATIDPEMEAAGRYYLSVVISSSAKGDLFEGAIGSTLLIDEVKLIK